jgi:hypothetical protein
MACYRDSFTFTLHTNRTELPQDTVQCRTYWLYIGMESGPLNQANNYQLSKAVRFFGSDCGLRMRIDLGNIKSTIACSNTVPVMIFIVVVLYWYSV